MTPWLDLIQSDADSGHSGNDLSRYFDLVKRSSQFLGLPDYDKQMDRVRGGQTPVTPLEVLDAAMSPLDSVTGAPVRAAVKSLQTDLDLGKAGKSYWDHLAEDPHKAPTAHDLVNGMGIYSPWASIPLSLAVGLGTDPLSYAPIAGQLGRLPKILEGIGELGALAPSMNKTAAKIDDLGFYSKLEDEIIKKMGKSATPQEIFGIVKSVKKDELAHFGLEKFLSGKNQVSKDELLYHIESRKPKLSLLENSDKISPADEVRIQQETVHLAREEARKIAAVDLPTYRVEQYGDRFLVLASDGSAISDYASRARAEVSAQNLVTRELMRREEALFSEMLRDPATLRAQVIDRRPWLAKGSRPARFPDRVEPGGDNYRELLISAPPDARFIEKELEQVQQETQGLLDSISMNMGKPSFDKASAMDRLAGLELKRAQLSEQSKGLHFKGGHWSDSDVLGHIRVNERTIPGVGKSLHAEEIQGDWPQQLRLFGSTEEGLQDKIRSTQEQLREHRGIGNASSAKLEAAEKLLTFSNPGLWIGDARSLLKTPAEHIENYVRNGGANTTYLRKLLESDATAFNQIVQGVSEIQRAHPEILDLASQTLDARHGLTRRLSKLNNMLADSISGSRSLPPETPFASSWEDLLAKQLVLHGARGGYNAVSITPGPLQANRWRNKSLIQAYKKPVGRLQSIFSSRGGKVGSFDLSGQPAPYFEFTEGMREDLLKNGLPLFSIPWLLMNGAEKR